MKKYKQYIKENSKSINESKSISFEQFFKNRDSKLIKIIGEKEWREDKMYFVNEIIKIVEDWQNEK